MPQKEKKHKVTGAGAHHQMPTISDIGKAIKSFETRIKTLEQENSKLQKYKDANGQLRAQISALKKFVKKLQKQLNTLNMSATELDTTLEAIS